MKRAYPDISELLALKEARRRRLALLPLEEKMEIAGRLRKLGEELRRAASAGQKISRPTKTRRATPKAR